jgi:uncharacterized membrane protein YoaK (UPF0700 family)
MIARMRANPGNAYLGLMLALTFSTGVIDAVGYLGLDRVFTGNMTGNVVILSMGLAGADDLPILGPFIALVGFMAGAAAAGRTLRGARDGWTRRHTWLFGTVAAVLASAAVTALVLDDPAGLVAYALTAALGLAMGCQAATARHFAVKDVTTVVVTSTLTGLAADSVLGRGTAQPWRRRAGAIALIAAGAAVGALLLQVHLGWGMLLAAAITVVVALLGHVTRPRPDFAPPYDGAASQ